MIKINDEYSLDCDSYQWIVSKHYMGASRKGREPKPQVKQTYHGNLTQAVKRIIDDSVKGCESVAEMSNRIDELAELLGKKLKPITEQM